jgi:hypothetical protein
MPPFGRLDALESASLEFLHFSGSGSADELFFGDLDLEFFQKFGVLGDFLA